MSAKDKAAPDGSACTHLDWPGLMRAGLLGLGLRPALFWALTPAELQFLLGQGGAARPAALGRAGFEALAKRWPDRADAADGENGDGRD